MNRTRRIITAMLMLVLMLTAWTQTVHGASEAWSIRIKDTAIVNGPNVLLGDIAEVVGESTPGSWERLSATELWKAPDYQGRLVQIPRERLKKLIAYYVPEIADSVSLPVKLTYQSGGKVYDRRDLHEIIVGFLTPRAAELDGEVKLRDFRVPPYVFINNEYDELEVALGSELKPGRVSIKMRVRSPEGRISKRLAATVFMDLWKPVPCAVRPLKRKEAVTPDKLVFIKKNVAYLGDAWDGRDGPWRMNRSVGAKQPITMAFLESMPMVARGDKVSLVYEGARVKLAVKAEVLDDADKGELVTVRNLQSKKEVLATVVDRNTVVVR